MLCDTCTNRRYCENEERQMCIANDYDRYDDDGSAYSSYDTEIDSVKTIFETMIDRTAEAGSRTLYKTCLSIQSMIDSTLGDMLLMNCIHAIQNC